MLCLVQHVLASTHTGRSRWQWWKRDPWQHEQVFGATLSRSVWPAHFQMRSAVSSFKMNMQAPEGEDAPEDSNECPVCYECLSGIERTLSCGHVFCHDCLVKTLVSVNKDGGVIKDMIICPICRHMTFLKKLEGLASEGTEKDAEGGQTLEVPVPAPTGNLQFRSARRDSRNSAPNGFNWIVRRLRIIVERLNRHRLIKPSPIDSQIFIISAQGRPMKEEDALSVVTVTVQPNRRQRRHRQKICTTSRCLVVLLLLFTLLALVAATLPWVLLA